MRNMNTEKRTMGRKKQSLGSCGLSTAALKKKVEEEEEKKEQGRRRRRRRGRKRRRSHSNQSRVTSYRYRL
jgi:hypothetical protein